MINTDTFLKIGSSHVVCEDYVLSGAHQLQYIILSDGCSSSPNTEMGSRILCYLARQYIRYRFDEFPANRSESFSLDYKDMGSWIIHNAEMSVRELGLPKTCLDATLMISYLDPFESNQTVNIFIYGDGFVVVVPDERSMVQIEEVEFAPDNMPFYLSYTIDPLRLQSYHEKKVSQFFSATQYDLSTYHWIDEYAYDRPMHLAFPMKNYKALLMFSDGLKSFIKQDPTNRENIPVANVIEGLIGFKNIKGKFLQRRVNKALKSLAKENITHYDDLSIGAYVNEELWDGNIQLDRFDGPPNVQTEVS